MTRFHRRNYFRGDIMDSYLASLGLFRKVMAKDESSLFRATAEQIYNTQSLHVELQKCCVAYIERNSSKFDNLNQLHSYIRALSLLYRHDFLIFREIGKPPVNVTNFGFSSKVTLCQSFGSHFDLVYPKVFQQQVAIFQSVVYETLYKKVFGMEKEVDTAVGLLRERGFLKSKVGYFNMDVTRYQHGRNDGSFHGSFFNGARFLQDHHTPNSQEPNLESSGEYSSGDDLMKQQMRLKGPPFPYKVAKILDPSIYRNIEYDNWLEEKKESFRAIHQRAQSESSVLTSSVDYRPMVRFASAPQPISRNGSNAQTNTWAKQHQQNTNSSSSDTQHSATPPPTTRGPHPPPPSPVAASTAPSVPQPRTPIGASMPPTTYVQLPYSAPPTIVSFVPAAPYFDGNCGPININVFPSQQISGSDLPLSDVTTLRYFYNLGCEYFRSFVSSVQMPIGNGGFDQQAAAFQQQAVPPPQALVRPYYAAPQTPREATGYYLTSLPDGSYAPTFVDNTSPANQIGAVYSYSRSV